jgi:hypothetical protein
MSTYNIREKFSYVLASSSIDYIRNYNFNTTTVTDIPLSMANLDTEVPITVNMTTTVPWIQIVNPTTGANLKFPSGNVVLGPTSTSVVLVKIDLPTDIESVSASVLYPDISLDIKSGSFPIIPPTGSTTTTFAKNTITVPQSTYTIDPGERVQIDITVYDTEGKPEKDVQNVVWKSNNTSIVQVEEPENTQIDYNPYTPRIIRGIGAGSTTVTITAGPERKTDITFVVRDTSTQTGDNTSGNVDNENGSGGATQFE